VINFVNLKIKSAQSFKGVYRGSVYVHVFIGMSAHTCMSICVYTVFLKKNRFEKVLGEYVDKWRVEIDQQHNLLEVAQSQPSAHDLIAVDLTCHRVGTCQCVPEIDRHTF
jgi:hypothetical protein